jgi:hypothetical protein
MELTCREVHMRDTARVEGLLSLFTSPGSAAAIAGDLTEERQHRGTIWFWLHASRTTVAFWRSALTDAPIMAILLAAAGCALLVGPAFVGVAAVFLFPSSDSPINWIALSFFWWSGALWTGASLVGIAPRRGMAACALLAVSGAALLIAFAVITQWHHGLSGRPVLLYANGLAVAALLLTGGGTARRRAVALGIPAME